MKAQNKSAPYIKIRITTRFIPLKVSANIQPSSKVIKALKHLVHVTFLIPFSTNLRSVVMKIIMMIK